MKTPQCNRAFAEMLASSVERYERECGKAWESLRQPRLHQRNVDSAFIVAIFLAAVAVILCCVR